MPDPAKSQDAPLDTGCLLLSSAGAGPAGSYRPTGFQLTGSGVDQGADRFAHLHEAHHAALNDSTAWGTSLHVSSRLPGMAATFARQLDRCRRVHETFATTAPLLMLADHHPELAAYVQATYPTYWRLHRAAEPLVRAATGVNRQYLLATQYARVCMQTRVLDQLVVALAEAHSAQFEGTQLRLDEPRARDTPDGRWTMLLRAGPDLARAACDAADLACGALDRGTDVLALDLPLGAQPAAPDGAHHTTERPEALDPAHDSVWAVWEATCYAVLADWLSTQGAVVCGFDGHRGPTLAVVEAARKLHPELGLGAAITNGPARDDRQVAAAVLEQARHVYASAGRWTATARSPGVDDIDDLIGAPTIIAGHRCLVVDARPVKRLRHLYDWGGDVHTGRDVTVAVRRINAAADGPGSSASTIEHLLLGTPAEAETVFDRWAHPTEPIACISASSLVEQDWVSLWWPVLSTRCTPFVLLDVEASRITPGFVRDQARARDRPGATRPDPTVLLGRIEVDDAGVLRHVVALRPGPGQPLWLSVHDDLGASVFIQALKSTEGLELETTVSHLEPLTTQLQIVLTHLLATESYFDTSGLTGRL